MCVHVHACLCVCDTGASPMLENETGHRPLAYVKNQQIKELLQESEQKVWFCHCVCLTFFTYLSSGSDISASAVSFCSQ